MKLKHYCILFLLIQVLYELNGQSLDLRGNPISSEENSQKKTGENYVPGEIIVKFKEGVLDSDFAKARLQIRKPNEVLRIDVSQRLLSKGVISVQKVVPKSTPDIKYSKSRKGENIPIPDFYNLLLLKVPLNSDLQLMCRQLEADESIEFAEPNGLRYPDQLPVNDTEFEEQLLLERFNQVDIDITRAWQINRGNNSIRVGIIDSGIDYHHEDFGNDFGTSAVKVTGGYNYEGNNGNPDDTNSHGTRMAGIVGALSNNGMGIAGIAGGDAQNANNGVQLIALKVDKPNGQYPLSNIIPAIYDGANSIGSGGYGCDILNMSYGDPTAFSSERKAISYAINNGVIISASKGNDGVTTPQYPSDYADNLIISVGWLDPFGNRHDDSNFGNNLDIMSPVHNTFTTDLNNGYNPVVGTSPAAASVAGIAALMLSENNNLHRDDIENILEITAIRDDDDYNYVNNYHIEMGHGQVNAGNAMELISNPFVLTHHQTFGGTSVKKSNDQQISFLNDANIPNTLAEAVYIADRYEITKTVSLPSFECENFSGPEHQMQQEVGLVPLQIIKWAIVSL